MPLIAQSMGNEHDELGICVQLQSYELNGIMETGSDGSYDWGVALEEYRLFRKDRMAR